MNIHPLVVHFPIALLTLYTAAEVLRFGFIRRHSAWFHLKAFLVIVGSIGAFGALQTGEIAEEAFGRSDMVEMHSLMGSLTTYVYGALALSYLIQWLERSQCCASSSLWKTITRIERTIFVWPVQVLLAITGFVLLTITGALGGALVYGPDMDPVVSFIYHLFFP